MTCDGTAIGEAMGSGLVAGGAAAAAGDAADALNGAGVQAPAAKAAERSSMNELRMILGARYPDKPRFPIDSRKIGLLQRLKSG